MTVSYTHLDVYKRQIKQMTEQGDFHRIALGIGVMSIFVMLLNRCLLYTSRCV